MAEGAEVIRKEFDRAEPWKPDEPGSISSPRSNWPSPIDIKEMAAKEPREPHFIVPGWLSTSYAALLSGHGGAGKSQIALAVSVAIAAGREWCGLKVERRKVLYLSCEDRKDVLHWRLKRICAHQGVDMAELDGWLFLLDLVGHETILWRDTGEDGLTGAYGQLQQVFRETGAEVLVVDGISDTFGGPENGRAEPKAFVNSLLSLIDPERGAVLLVGHVNKVAAASPRTSEGYSGNTAWHNAVRTRWYLRPEADQDDDGTQRRTGELVLELQKSNLGPGDRSISLHWSDDAGLFVPSQPETGTVAAIRDETERNSVLDALAAVAERGDYCPAANTGPRTAFHVLSATGKLHPKLASGSAARRRFWRHVENLRASGEIEEGSIRREGDRHSVRTLALSQQNQGLRGCGQ